MKRFILYFLLFLFIPGYTYSTSYLYAEVSLDSMKHKKGIVPSTELNPATVLKKPYVVLKIKKPLEKMIIVDPRKHVWQAYSPSGILIKSGMATLGSSWCGDICRPCRTKVGVFRIYSLGSSNCVSKKFPVGRGGAPMPYCMYFNGGQGIHGSYEVVRGNISHGCVRVHVSDARWLRFNFVNVGTKVVIKPY